MSKKFVPGMVLLDSNFGVGSSGGSGVVQGPENPEATYMTPAGEIYYWLEDGYHCLYEGSEGHENCQVYSSVQQDWIKIGD